MSQLIEDLFALRGRLSAEVSSFLSFAGIILLVLVWQLVCMSGYVNHLILPSPMSVLTSFKELWTDDALLINTVYSIKLNMLGYAEAIAICIPLGFVIGLFPIFREMFNKILNSIRFLPLPATMGLFIVWFGIESNMKVQFLALGIIVYLLPVVVECVQEVDETYIQTIQTLSNSKWQAIRRVFIPAVLSAVSTQIMVLIAISWTYITIAELVNKTGGIGALAFVASRQSRIDKVFAILLLILVIGYIQDLTMRFLDKIIFPHKYAHE